MPAPHAVRSFGAATPAGGRTGKGPGERGRGAQPDPTGGPPPDLGGQGSGWKGPLEVGPTPFLLPVLLGLPWRRFAQAGVRWALAGEREMP